MKNNNKEYMFNKKTKTIDAYIGNKEVVSIPKKINGVVVENIGHQAFKAKKISIIIIN